MHRIPSDWRSWLVLGLLVVAGCAITQFLVVHFGRPCATVVPAALLALAMASWIRERHNRFERYLEYDDEAEPDNVYQLPPRPPRLVDRTTDPPDDPPNDAA